MATLVACGWAGAVLKKVTGAFGHLVKKKLRWSIPATSRYPRALMSEYFRICHAINQVYEFIFKNESTQAEPKLAR